MEGIVIKDQIPDGSSLSFDLHDVILAIEDELLSSQWECSSVECLGNSSEDLHRFSDKELFVSTDQLLTISSGIYQTIEGKFEAFRQNHPGESPWVVIEIRDGAYFIVWSSEQKILAKLRSRFTQVERYDESTHIVWMPTQSTKTKVEIPNKTYQPAQSSCQKQLEPVVKVFRDALSLSKNGYYREAISKYKNCLTIASQEHITIPVDLLVPIIVNTGYCYAELGDAKNTLDSYQVAERVLLRDKEFVGQLSSRLGIEIIIFVEKDFRPMLMSFYHSFGMFYESLGNVERAKEYFDLAEKIYQELN